MLLIQLMVSFGAIQIYIYIYIYIYVYIQPSDYCVRLHCFLVLNTGRRCCFCPLKVRAASSPAEMFIANRRART